MNATISYEELRRGCQLYRQVEKRDPMYRVATFLINTFWGDPGKMTDGLGVLLLTWNQAFYRYGQPDLDELERYLRSWQGGLEHYRHRDLVLCPSNNKHKS